MTIEISYLFALAVLLMCSIAVWTKKLGIGIAIISILGALGISYYFAPYTQLVAKQVAYSVAYGYAWDLLSILALAHIVSIMAMAAVAAYNLYKSGGKIIWA